jgi:hypothetical protein
MGIAIKRVIFITQWHFKAEVNQLTASHKAIPPPKSLAWNLTRTKTALGKREPPNPPYPYCKRFLIGFPAIPE